VEYNNKGKLKEKNSSRLTEPESRLKVTKGKGLGRVGLKGGISVGRKNGGIRISMYNAWCRVCMGSTVQHRED